MSNVYKFPKPADNCAAEACEWLARLERGLSEQEESALRAWLDAHPASAPALLEAAALWDRMDSLARLADLFPKPVPRRAALASLKLVVAASITIVVSLGLFLLTKAADDQQSIESTQVASVLPEQAFETAVGEHSTIRLADGSELTLNTNSRVRVQFSADRRTLRLERGEVFVRVAHDASRPLTVWAANRLVRAVGTEFNVQITSDQRVEVIVTDGKVLIGVARAQEKAAKPSWIEEFDTTLMAGQRAVLSGEKPAVEDLGAKVIDVKLSWREGNLVFHGEPLAEALGQIERYTSVTFVIRDEELKTIRVAGLFKAGDVDGLLATLRENFNISYERVGPEKIVLKSE